MILVIGSGVAGLTCAINAAELGADVMLVTPGTFDAETLAVSQLAGGNTALAQGGIAGAVGKADRVEWHIADTIAAGAGLVDIEAATQLCTDGASAVRRLLELGFAADRGDDAELALGLEAAHGHARIVHAGEDRTGAALHAFLSARFAELLLAERAQIIEQSTAVSLLTEHDRVSGALLRRTGGELSVVQADCVVLATGGYAGLYSRTSNHVGARGQGVLLAARARAVVADLEFVQFHPTVLAGTGFLISEAVRGAGAVLRDDAGKRFMLEAHEAGELAPRDVVSRAVHRQLMRGSGVWLDATGIERESGQGTLSKRFPAITANLLDHGIDWSRSLVGVTPAAHYSMGGVVTDLDGRTSAPGLFAAGEVASTGVHGANRLASNSLLEGLVFGARAAAAAVAYAAPLAFGGQCWKPRGIAASKLFATAHQMPVARPLPRSEGAQGCSDRELAAAFDRLLGIEREATGLAEMKHLAASCSSDSAELAGMIATAADARRESRGSHQRSDFSESDVHRVERTAWVSTQPLQHQHANIGQSMRSA